ncbi:hypothetical protein A0W34_29980 (plasmid) [Rhodococcus sp. BH4]|uniref:PaaI family thioesterase n=1 Tax=Rhodococcus sp. BH4 TaxID=1807790 RepID=UPI0009C37D30|nr:PaaI family thioesterase [Rhodococcus sp. BH4]ARE37756.1 hypothetical protein A0W34_29980 [Rhodococcus sp. BH4]
MTEQRLPIKPISTVGDQTDSWAHLGPMDERGGAGYADFVQTVRRLQNCIVAADAPADVLAEARTKLEQAFDLLAPYEAPETETPVGTRLDLPGRGHPLLLPHIVDEWTPSHVRARVTFGRFYLGGNGAAHGGSLPLLFDEVLGRLASTTRPVARTAYIHVNYRHITPVDRELVLDATIDSIDGRKRFASARLLDGDRVVSDAEGLFVQLRPGQP